MRTVQLSASTSIKLDGAGGGTATVGPEAPGETWDAGYTVGVRCATNAAEAIASAWCGGGPPRGFIGSTTWGSTGDANSDTPQVSVGQSVTVTWTGGDPGATAYLTVTGTRQVP